MGLPTGFGPGCPGIRGQGEYGDSRNTKNPGQRKPGTVYRFLAFALWLLWRSGSRTNLKSTKTVYCPFFLSPFFVPVFLLRQLGVEGNQMYELPWLDGIRWFAVPIAYHQGGRDPDAAYIYGVDVGLVLFGVVVIPLAWLLYTVLRKRK